MNIFENFLKKEMIPIIYLVLLTETVTSVKLEHKYQSDENSNAVSSVVSSVDDDHKKPTSNIDSQSLDVQGSLQQDEQTSNNFECKEGIDLLQSSTNGMCVNKLTERFCFCFDCCSCPDFCQVEDDQMTADDTNVRLYKCEEDKECVMFVEEQQLKTFSCEIIISNKHIKEEKKDTIINAVKTELSAQDQKYQSDENSNAVSSVVSSVDDDHKKPTLNIDSQSLDVQGSLQQDEQTSNNFECKEGIDLLQSSTNGMCVNKLTERFCFCFDCCSCPDFCQVEDDQMTADDTNVRLYKCEEDKECVMFVEEQQLKTFSCEIIISNKHIKEEKKDTIINAVKTELSAQDQQNSYRVSENARMNGCILSARRRPRQLSRLITEGPDWTLPPPS
ncbi:hypothetical protein J6590_094251 [Homalodisca vitripennis]|nr:hypothetical protein J6590_094251 [Homalodisca vitripennis]